MDSQATAPSNEIPAAAIITGQPELFSPDSLDTRFVEELVHYSHTGKSLTSDPEELAAIVESLCAGMSQRAVARRFRRSRSTIRKAVAALEEAGKLEPLEKRSSRKMGAIIESGLEALQERVDRDEVPANVLPVMIGILSDKKAVLDGKPVSIQETRQVLSIESFNEIVSRLPAAKLADRAGETVLDADVIEPEKAEIGGSSDRQSEGNEANV